MVVALELGVQRLPEIATELAGAIVGLSDRLAYYSATFGGVGGERRATGASGS